MGKLLVTGSGGFIGSNLMNILDDAVGYDLKSGQDIRDKEQLRSYMKNCDVVVHLAAQTSVANCWKDPTEYYSHNIVGTSNVIETAIKCKVKHIVYASSATVYSPMANPYAVSKTTAENLFKLRSEEIKTIAFRFMNVYGKGQNPEYGTVIPAFYKGIKEKKIKIFGDGDYTRDYVHVSDVVSVLKMATEDQYAGKFKGFNVMDLGTGVEISTKDLANKMISIFGRAKISHTPPRSEAQTSVADTTFLKKYFNLPKVSLDEGLKLIKEKGI